MNFELAKTRNGKRMILTSVPANISMVYTLTDAGGSARDRVKCSQCRKVKGFSAASITFKDDVGFVPEKAATTVKHACAGIERTKVVGQQIRLESAHLITEVSNIKAVKAVKRAAHDIFDSVPGDQQQAFADGVGSKAALKMYSSRKSKGNSMADPRIKPVSGLSGNQILQSALNEANAQINHLKEQLDKVLSQNPVSGNNQLISMNQKLRLELSAMTAKFETTEKQRHESAEQVGYLNRVLVQAIAAEAELKAEIAQLKSNHGNSNFKYVELESGFMGVQSELQKVKDQRDGAIARAAKYKLEWEYAVKKSKETEVLLAKTKQELELRMGHLRAAHLGMVRMKEKMKQQEAGKDTYKQGACCNMLEPDAKQPPVKPMPEIKSLVEELQDKIKTIDRDLEKERNSRRRDQKTVVELQKEMEKTRKTMNHLIQTPSTSSRKRQSNEKSPSRSASHESSIEPSKRPHLEKESTRELSTTINSSRPSQSTRDSAIE